MKDKKKKVGFGKAVGIGAIIVGNKLKKFMKNTPVRAEEAYKSRILNLDRTTQIRKKEVALLKLNREADKLRPQQGIFDETGFGGFGHGMHSPQKKPLISVKKKMVSTGYVKVSGTNLYRKSAKTKYRKSASQKPAQKMPDPFDSLLGF